MQRVCGVERSIQGFGGGKETRGSPRCRWEDNIKMGLQEVGRGGMDWLDLAQDRDCWQELANGLIKCGEFLDQLKTRFASQEGLKSVD